MILISISEHYEMIKSSIYFYVKDRFRFFSHCCWKLESIQQKEGKRYRFAGWGEGKNIKRIFFWQYHKLRNKNQNTDFLPSFTSLYTMWLTLWDVYSHRALRTLSTRRLEGLILSLYDFIQISYHHAKCSRKKKEPINVACL